MADAAVTRDCFLQDPSLPTERNRARARTAALGIFAGLCADADARGNLIPDAYFAALAIETVSEWLTTHGDYRRFRGLRLRHPLDP